VLSSARRIPFNTIFQVFIIQIYRITMKEAICRLGPRVEIHDVPIPTPGPDEVLTKVVVSGSNPKDWKMAEWGLGERNEGDDIAGYVHSIGSNVTEFHPGDRIAAFHRIRTPHGSYAEYAISPSHTTFHIPKHTSFEEAATIPLAAMTAAVGLYVRLKLPQPFTSPSDAIPLLIYGAASAVGAYAIQLAVHSGIHPLICVAGKGASFVEKLIDRSQGDTIVDYRDGDDAVVQGIKSALPSGQKLLHGFDCVSAKGSYANCCNAISHDGGKLTMVLRVKDFDYGGVQQSDTMVGSVQGDKTYSKSDPDDHDFGFAWFRMFSLGLKEGWLRGHPYEVVPGGLGGVQQGLINLKEGKASAVKYVFRIADTVGVGADANGTNGHY
jgi:NADPH2:quinone reductase